MPRVYVGDVTINADGTDSGTGLSWEMYVEQRNRESFANPAQPIAGWPGTQSEWSIIATGTIVATKSFFARQAIAYATALVPYLLGDDTDGYIWRFRGTYAGNLQYNAGDVVRHDEALFMALVDTINNPPRTNDVLHADWYFVYGSPHDHLKFGTGTYPATGKIRVGDSGTDANKAVITVYDSINGADVQFMRQTRTGDIHFPRDKRLIHGAVSNSTGILTDGWEVKQTENASPGNQGLWTTYWTSEDFPNNASIVVEGLITLDRDTGSKHASVSFHAKFKTDGSGIPTQKDITYFGQPFKDSATLDWRVQVGSGGSADRVVVQVNDDGFVWNVKVVATTTVTP